MSFASDLSMAIHPIIPLNIICPERAYSKLSKYTFGLTLTLPSQELYPPKVGRKSPKSAIFSEMMTSQICRMTSHMATNIDILSTTLGPTPMPHFVWFGQIWSQLWPKNLQNCQNLPKRAWSPKNDVIAPDDVILGGRFISENIRL